jgi:MFS family permease
LTNAASPGPKARWNLATAITTAELITRAGDAVTDIALPLLAISVLGAGPAEIAIIGAAQALPALLLSLPAGAWVDRRRRRAPIVIAADFARFVLLVSIPLAAITGYLSLPLVVLVAFLASCAGTLYDVGFTGWIPRVLKGDVLHRANARMELARSAALITGPATGGLLVSLAGAANALAADALSFLASGALLFGMRKTEPDQEQTRSRPRMLADVTAGFRFVLGQPIVRAIIATASTNNFFRSVAMAVAFLYLVNEAGVTAAGIGVTVAIGNLGFVLGALASRPLSRRFGVGRAMQMGVGLFGPASLVFALAPLPLAAPAFTLMLFAHGLGQAIHGPNQVTLRQVLVPDNLRSRVGAVYRLTIFGATPLGIMLGGVIGQLYGLHAALLVGALGLFLGSAPYILSRVSRVRTLEDASSAQ